MESQQPPVAGKKIIILGAGIAGLAFVISLRKEWPESHPFPDVVVYERDDKESSIGREGFSISIRGDMYSGGLQTLEAMGILEQASAVAVSGTGSENSGGFGMWDLDWYRFLDFGREQMMRIARGALRRILVDAALDSEGVRIRWSTAFAHLNVSDGKAAVDLSDGTVDNADIVIAADGANSNARTLFRPDDGLSFAGAVSLSGTARFPDGQVPAPVNRDWGFVLGGNGAGLFISPISSTAALWSLSYVTKNPREDTKRPYTAAQIESFLEEALDRGESFKEPFQTLVRNTDPSTFMILNAMDKQPFTHTELQASVIYIGDSNHAISPFSGNGANMALLDGWELGVQFAKFQSLSEALAEYDKSSIPRCQSALNMSRWSIDMAHAMGWKLFFYKIGMKCISLLSKLKG